MSLAAMGVKMTSASCHFPAANQFMAHRLREASINISMCHLFMSRVLGDQKGAFMSEKVAADIMKAARVSSTL